MAGGATGCMQERRLRRRIYQVSVLIGLLWLWLGPGFKLAWWLLMLEDNLFWFLAALLAIPMIIAAAKAPDGRLNSRVFAALFFAVWTTDFLKSIWFSTRLSLGKGDERAALSLLVVVVGLGIGLGLSAVVWLLNLGLNAVSLRHRHRFLGRGGVLSPRLSWPLKALALVFLAHGSVVRYLWMPGVEIKLAELRWFS